MLDFSIYNTHTRDLIYKEQVPIHLNQLAIAIFSTFLSIKKYCYLCLNFVGIIMENLVLII